MKILSHRANGFGKPENTLSAFLEVLKSSVSGIETDVQLTKDDEVIVHHDDELGRIFSGNEAISQLTFEELSSRACLVSDYENERIPKLSELLKLYKGTGKEINIELKVSEGADYQKLIEKTLEEVKKAEMEAQVYYSSFHEETLRYLKEVDDSVGSFLLFWTNEPTKAELNALHVQSHINGFHLFIDKWNEKSEALQNEMLQSMTIRLWTVNQKEHFPENIEAIITDVR